MKRMRHSGVSNMNNKEIAYKNNQIKFIWLCYHFKQFTYINYSKQKVFSFIKIKMSGFDGNFS